MKTAKPELSRRQFCSWLAGAALAISLPGLTGCGQFQPVPFHTGAEVPAPDGCRELLARDARGDC